jgi:Arc/MetJ-type ribon-helix-helix transcriptional regulator
MSKITFRADEDLIEQVEAVGGSKSEVMREALRAYLGIEEQREARADRTLDALVGERIDELVEQRLAEQRLGAARDVDIDITVEPAGQTTVDTNDDEDLTEDDVDHEEGIDAVQTSEQPCSQCGEALSEGDVYCSNCGEKAAHRSFCECGDELRSDWAYCPSCGRRTPSADVLGE